MLNNNSSTQSNVNNSSVVLAAQLSEMSSIEISEVTGKRHDAVLRDIRKLLKQGVAAHNFVVSEYTDATGRKLPCYNLTKKGSLILASGYNAVLREKIIDRWEALETGKEKPYYQSFQVPQSFSDALMLAAQQQKQIEEQAKQLEAKDKQIEHLEEMTEYTRTILDSPSTVFITQIAQDYGLSAMKLNSILRDMGIQRRAGNQWILYAKYLKEGYVQSHTHKFKHKDGRDDVALTTKWTQKGRLFLYNELKKRNVIPLIEQRFI